MSVKKYSGEQLAWNLWWDVTRAIENSMTKDDIHRLISKQMQNVCLLDNNIYSKVEWENKRRGRTNTPKNNGLKKPEVTTEKPHK